MKKLIFLAAVLTLGFASCSTSESEAKEGIEALTNSLEQLGEQAKDAVDEAAKEAEAATKEAGEAMEDATKEAEAAHE